MNLFHEDNMNYLLEPTPLDTSRMKHVEKVSLFDVSLSGSYLEDLQPLLSLQSTNPKFPKFDFSDYAKFDEKIQPSHWYYFADKVWSEEPYDNQDKAEGRHVNFRSQHLDLWDKRYQQLVQFKAELSHCNVPLNYKTNPCLSNWTKRQRHQYRLKMEGRHTTLTEERQVMLENLGFVWDSHAAAWNERWEQLRDFRLEHGHSRVPKNYPKNQPLAIWVKCQRRQFRLWSQNKRSNITRERVERLKDLDFVFNPRCNIRAAW
ncbi:unnamed protein product [Cylindrotheca closterium]|uniref:Helicase-associated domain-containing protein n=1 Tax=Cylindrotheca closterium TaxID=2856 RepID=A0AAD2JN06_9STRA|nr:unnamed protein product [Cylindrotheca closterium]